MVHTDMDEYLFGKPVPVSLTSVTAQKCYNCPKCGGLVPLGMECGCTMLVVKPKPHCPTCTCSADSAEGKQP